ncbi:hypothetical protein N7445_002107 [Penicillium cf. griseofulvum]|nr:hypothetical protein N7445_002107 [Penicillium cf. griseofulvum]
MFSDMHDRTNPTLASNLVSLDVTDFNSRYGYDRHNNIYELSELDETKPQGHKAVLDTVTQVPVYRRICSDSDMCFTQKFQRPDISFRILLASVSSLLRLKVPS